MKKKSEKNEHKMAGHIRTNNKNKHSQLNKYIKSSLFQDVKNETQGDCWFQKP
jgi:hypothetical protein